jgi:hypothetical protein
MRGTKVNRTKSNGQLPKIHLHDKSSGSDVFENIHLFLKGLQSDISLDEKVVVPRDEIYRRLFKYKNMKENRLMYMTCSEWAKISMNR